MRGKKGQFFETLIIIGGIAMVLTAVFAVIYSRSSIPSDSPNLQAKEILQTQEAFDAIEFFIELSFADAVQRTDLLQSVIQTNKSVCAKKMSFNQNIVTILLRTCWYPYAYDKFEENVRLKLNESFTTQQTLLDSYKSTQHVYRKTALEYSLYPAALWAHNFDATQMDISLMQNGTNQVMVGVYRKPLEYTTASSQLWKLEARRFVFVKAPFAQTSQVTASVLSIHNSLLVETFKIMDGHRKERAANNNMGPATAEEKAQMLSEINTALLKIEPRLSLNKSSYYLYNLTAQSDTVYVLFPNLQFGLELMPFI